MENNCKHERRIDVSSNYRWVTTPQIVGINEHGELSSLVSVELPKGSVFDCPDCGSTFSVSKGTEVPMPDKRAMRAIVDDMPHEPFGVPNVKTDQELFTELEKREA